MSTTIKRIALVAVAAMGLGVMSVAPSTATTNADTLTLSAATATQLTSETATATSAVATLSYLADSAADSMSVTVSLVSAPAGNVALPRLLLVETASAQASLTAPAGTVIALGATVGTAANTRVFVVPSGTPPVNASAKFRVYLDAPTVVGTYVVRVTPAVTGVGVLNATAQTLTITVSQNVATSTVTATADSFINAGETISATADVTVTGALTASTSAAAATILVTQKNANGNTVTAESYTATISGPGILGSGAFGSGTTLDNAVVATGRAITVKNGDVVAVFPDGTSGVATITIGSSAGVILATERVTFFGAAARIVTTVSKAVIATGAQADVLSIVVTDAAGTNVSNLQNVNIVSSNTAAITGAYTSATATYSTVTGAYLVPLNGVAAGTANITVTTKASATATTGVDAAAVAVRVGSSTPASVTVTLDKTSYAPGERATLSVKLFDATGLAIADGVDNYTNIFAVGGIVGNYTINGDTTTATSVLGFAAGAKNYTVFMPVTEGTVTFSWTTGAGLAVANRAVKGSVSAEVSSVSTSAAIDAANEAASAAQDATDAAIQAADAADEATAAVAALTLEVNTLIAGLKKQLTTLTNLVIRIQKKVKA